MLNSERIPIPRLPRSQKVSIYPLDVPGLFLGRQRDGNMPTMSTFFRSPYNDGIIRQLDVQCNNTVLYTATLKTALDLAMDNDAQTRGILKNSTNQSLSNRQTVCKKFELKQKQSKLNETSNKENRNQVHKKLPQSARLSRDRPGSWSPGSARAAEYKRSSARQNRPISVKLKHQSRSSQCINCNLIQSSRTEKQQESNALAHVQIDDAFARLDRLELKYGKPNTDGMESDKEIKPTIRNTWVDQNTVDVLNNNNPPSLSFSPSSVSTNLTGSVNVTDMQNSSPSEIKTDNALHTNNCISVEIKNDNNNINENITKQTHSKVSDINVETKSKSNSSVSGIISKVSSKSLSDEADTLLTSASRVTGTRNDADLNSSQNRLASPKMNISNKVKCLYEKDANNKKTKSTYPTIEETKPKVVLDGSKSPLKTTENTTGGAVVTRSHVRPVMFSRLLPDPFSSSSYRMIKKPKTNQVNFCDAGKTDQIVQWLRHVREVQSTEGLCMNSESEIETNNTTRE